MTNFSCIFVIDFLVVRDLKFSSIYMYFYKIFKTFAIRRIGMSVSEGDVPVENVPHGISLDLFSTLTCVCI